MWSVVNLPMPLGACRRSRWVCLSCRQGFFPVTWFLVKDGELSPVVTKGDGKRLWEENSSNRVEIADVRQLMNHRETPRSAHQFVIVTLMLVVDCTERKRASVVFDITIIGQSHKFDHVLDIDIDRVAELEEGCFATDDVPMLCD